MKTKIIFLIILFFSSPLWAQEFPLAQLKQFADGLNIEGGDIPMKYLHEGQIWSNLCVVEDRPFLDGFEWQELTRLNNFPLKEAAILDYNEAQVNWAYLAMMYYYIKEAQHITHKSERVKILIQVHRNTSGPPHIDLLQKLLDEAPLEKIQLQNEASSKYIPAAYFFPEHNVELEFCFGSKNMHELGFKYEEVDIVIGFSLVAGFNPDWKSGSFFIPTRHIPFSLKTLILEEEKQYEVPNHLLKALPFIIEDQKSLSLLAFHKKFSSPNPLKKQIAKPLTLEDFKEACLLQVDGNFNPSELPAYFKKSL